MTADPESGRESREQQQDGTAVLLELLRQPIAAASNYIGAARLVIEPLQNEASRKALDLLEKSERELLRAGKVIARLHGPPKGNGGSAVGH